MLRILVLCNEYHARFVVSSVLPRLDQSAYQVIMKIYQHMLLHPFCFTVPHFSRKIQFAVPCNDHDCVGKLIENGLGTRWADVSCIFNIVVWPTGCD